MTTPYPQIEKPKRPRGTTCPLRGGKDVSKVCHTCDFYQVIQGKLLNKKNPDDTGAWFDHWACTLAHGHLFQAQVAGRMEENTIEQNVLRGAIQEGNTKLGELMSKLGRTIDTVIEIVASTRVPQNYLTQESTTPLLEASRVRS